MSLNIQKVAIANRGEVAVRIIAACKELGLETVLLHSSVDESTLAHRQADEKICIGSGEASQSYLDISANIQGALSAGADAIHPGFGFLSENAEFAKACSDNRLVFIGPDPSSIELFGDKISAKKLVEKTTCPLIPGYQGEDQSLPVLLQKCEEIGYPLMVKAAAGGGGRGLKVIQSPEERQPAIESAQREGLSAFGSSQVFLEKYLADAKHIEIQIFGAVDGEVFTLGERDCSIQRRHQKIIEEAPSAVVDENLRARLCAEAKAIAVAAKYRGAGTVEFLLHGEDFYFLEMNTRLQVEHPVTEQVMSVDLVKAQIRTAMGEKVSWQNLGGPRGHAIECRIYAEDPYTEGRPSTGLLLGTDWPIGPHRRFELGFEAGDEVTPFYDSMIAKVVVWDEDRRSAILKMIQTLKESVVFGLKTNIPFLIEMLSHSEFRTGNHTTQFVDRYFPAGLKPIKKSSRQSSLEEILEKKLSGSSVIPKGPQVGPSPWESLGGDL